MFPIIGGYMLPLKDVEVFLKKVECLEGSVDSGDVFLAISDWCQTQENQAKEKHNCPPHLNFINDAGNDDLVMFLAVSVGLFRKPRAQKPESNRARAMKAAFLAATEGGYVGEMVWASVRKDKLVLPVSWNSPSRKASRASEK